MAADPHAHLSGASALTQRRTTRRFVIVVPRTVASAENDPKSSSIDDARSGACGRPGECGVYVSMRVIVPGANVYRVSTRL
jgi:hypothetical protein